MVRKNRRNITAIAASVVVIMAGCSSRVQDVQNNTVSGTIQSADGEIISAEYEAMEKYSVTVPDTSMDETAAKQLVMSRIPGISEANIWLHADYDDGRSTYEGEAYHEEIKYEFEIDAATGTITDWDAESIYD